MLKAYFDLFITFFKIGAFTFGGGWAMISIIEREVVTKHQWVEKEEFLDLLALAQSLPGIFAVNISIAIGNNIYGKKGSVCAALATILPSFLIILAIAIFLTPETIKDSEVLTKIFKGIRPAVVALIIQPVITTGKSAKLTLKSIWIPIVVAVLIYLNIPYLSNPILYILLGGLCGVYFYKKKVEVK